MFELLFSSKNKIEKKGKNVPSFPPQSIEKALDSANTMPKSDGRSLSGISIDKRHTTALDGKITIKDNMISALKAGIGEEEVEEIDNEVIRLRQRMEFLLDSRKDLVAVINALKPGRYPES